MLKVCNGFAKVGISLAAMLLAGPAFGQQPSPSVLDSAARSEIRKVRATVDDLAREVREAGRSPKTTPDTEAVKRIAANLDALVARQGRSENGWNWGIPLLSMVLSAAVAYWVARASRLPVPPMESAVIGLNGETQAISMDGDVTKIGALSQIRSRMNELERDARSYAEIYTLMLAYRTARNAPLQRLAEISTREQEALLRYRNAAGEIVSLGFEYGAIPDRLRDPGEPEDLGDWLANWWNSLEETLEPDAPTSEALDRRNELFRQARNKLKALSEEARAPRLGAVTVL